MSFYSNKKLLNIAYCKIPGYVVTFWKLIKNYWNFLSWNFTFLFHFLTFYISWDHLSRLPYYHSYQKHILNIVCFEFIKFYSRKLFKFNLYLTTYEIIFNFNIMYNENWGYQQFSCMLYSLYWVMYIIIKSKHKSS